MATTFHDRVQALLELAAQQPTGARTRFVRARCPDDTALQAEAIELLSHFRRAAENETPGAGLAGWKCPGTSTIGQASDRALDVRRQAEALTASPQGRDVQPTVVAAPTRSDPLLSGPTRTPTQTPTQPAAQPAARAKGRGRSAADSGAPQPPFCLDQYRVVELLGCGGMGVVYRAQHATLQCPVALKLMLTAKVSTDLQRRFALEVEILRQLRHPHIAWFIHTNTAPLRHESPQGVQYVQTPYYVMEYVNGAPLNVYADLHDLSVRPRLKLLAQIADAADFAHRRGVIHRDLKPDNILVDEHGDPKILDFGIARLEDAMISVLADERGKFIGTPRYASPEQMAGDTHRLTAKSDVFALGLIAHELLTGRLPSWRGRRIELRLESLRLDDELDRPAISVRELRFHLRELLSAALQHDPDLRLASAALFAERLRKIERDSFRPAPHSWWQRLLERIRPQRGPREHASEANAAARPLRAVLQARIRMGVEAREPAPVSPDPATTRAL